MKSFASYLRGLPRSAIIEAIYLVGHELTPALPSPLEAGAPNDALTTEELLLARASAQAMLQAIEDYHGKPVSSLDESERSALVSNLDGYLRKLTRHSAAVRSQANSALEEFRELAF